MFCHFLIMNPLGTTTTLYISQLFSSTKVYLLFYSHKKLVNNMENKKKRPWTFSWTQQKFCLRGGKRCPEIMKSCDQFFFNFSDNQFQFIKGMCYILLLEVMIYFVTLCLFAFVFFNTNKSFTTNKQMMSRSMTLYL